jgi:hypothetical protein
VFDSFSFSYLRKNLFLFYPPPHGATYCSGLEPRYRGFTITFRYITVGRRPLDEWSARRRDLYLTSHNTHKRQISMPTGGFEPAIPESERPQTHALDRAATGIGFVSLSNKNNVLFWDFKFSYQCCCRLNSSVYLGCCPWRRAALNSETSVTTYQSTRRNVPEGLTHHKHSREESNLKRTVLKCEEMGKNQPLIKSFCSYEQQIGKWKFWEILKA